MFTHVSMFTQLLHVSMFINKFSLQFMASAIIFVCVFFSGSGQDSNFSTSTFEALPIKHSAVWPSPKDDGSLANKLYTL